LVIIDEVQHAPDIFPAPKLSVGRDQHPGRFLLTGSANILLLLRVSESLADRKAGFACDGDDGKNILPDNVEDFIEVA
jgi:predicted AAA+ superfamily ATPase